MFPVLIRIPNEDGLLRPGMNSEVEIRVASRQGVLTVPDAALRTSNDFASAAAVLGLDIETVEAQLHDARQGLAMGNGTVNENSEGDAGSGFQFGGDFIVFALRDGVPKPIPIRTGLTDLDYHEVLAGDLTEADSLVVLTAVGAAQAPPGGR